MAEKEMKRRTRYITDKNFQARYIVKALVLMLLISIIFAWTVYRSGWIPLVEKLSDVYPQKMLVPILKAVNIKLIINLLLLVPIVILFAVYLSHKIAGPLVRIERDIKAVAKGDLKMRLSLRRKDELKSLAQSINEMTESIEEMVRKNSSSVAEMKEVTKELLATLEKTSPSREESLQAVGKLNKGIDEISDTLSRYKLS